MPFIKTWMGDAVDALMQRHDIIRRAFRGTGVGIDIEGKEKSCLRFQAMTPTKVQALMKSIMIKNYPLLR